MQTLIIIVNVVLLIVIGLAILSSKKDKITSKVLFETREFKIYKIMTYVGILSFVMLMSILIQLLFNTNTEDTALLVSGITWLLVFFSQMVTYPKQMIMTEEAIYYPMRLNGLKKVSSFKNIGSFSITEKGKLKVKSKADSKIEVVIMGKLSLEEQEIINDLFSEKGLKMD